MGDTLRRSRHAKIVATAGPASAEPEKIRALYLSGVDIFRLNFSHGTHEDHAKSYVCIGELDREFGRPIGILQDLQGLKLRIGSLEEGRLVLRAGETVRFVMMEPTEQSNRYPCLIRRFLQPSIPDKNFSLTMAGCA